MKRFLSKILLLFLLPILFYSCVNKEYDIDNIEDSDEIGGFSPELSLPIGTLKIEILDFINSAGIDTANLVRDTIGTLNSMYAKYTGDRISLSPVWTEGIWAGNGVIDPFVPVVNPDGTIKNILEWLDKYLEEVGEIPDTDTDVKFEGGQESMSVDFFKELGEGNVLLPSNPTIKFTITNYIGANLDIDINGIKSSKNNGDDEVSAKFEDGSTTSVITVEKATGINTPEITWPTFDRDNGKLNTLFAKSPDIISYDFGMTLKIPKDKGSFFMLEDKFVDIDYEVQLPFQFDKGTQLSYESVMDFDDLDEDYINKLDTLSLQISYINTLHTNVKLEIIFLDESANEIPGITRTLEIKTAENTTKADPVKFGKNNVESLKKAKSIKIKSTLIVVEDESEIRPKDYINLNLSADIKVKI